MQGIPGTVTNRYLNTQQPRKLQINKPVLTFAGDDVAIGKLNPAFLQGPSGLEFPLGIQRNGGTLTNEEVLRFLQASGDVSPESLGRIIRPVSGAYNRDIVNNDYLLNFFGDYLATPDGVRFLNSVIFERDSSYPEQARLLERPAVLFMLQDDEKALIQEVFESLQQAGWIESRGDGFAITPAGEQLLNDSPRAEQITATCEHLDRQQRDILSNRLANEFMRVTRDAQRDARDLFMPRGSVSVNGKKVARNSLAIDAFLRLGIIQRTSSRLKFLPDRYTLTPTGAQIIRTYQQP